MMQQKELLTNTDQIDKIINSFPLDELISQMFIPILTCPWQQEPTAEERLKQAIDFQVGGVFVAPAMNDDKTREIISELRNNSRIPPLVCADIEFSSPLRNSVNFGRAMNVGAINDLEKARELTYLCGSYNAKYARSIGINWALGPAVDLPFNCDSPMCGSRLFSANPDFVAQLSGSYITGMQENGLACCLKHFPGDGTDSRDHHLVTPVNELDLPTWLETYGKTFKAGINNDVYSVMMGHIALNGYSSTNPKSGILMPASLDSKIQTGLLREKLGFKGVVVSDAIGMAGITSHCKNMTEAAIRNIESGSDMVLFVKDLPAAVKSMKDSLKQGNITEKRIYNSVKRIITMKSKLHLFNRDVGNIESYQKSAEDKAAENVAIEIAGESITLVRDFNNDIPLNLEPEAKITVCILPGEPGSSADILLPEQTMKVNNENEVIKELSKQGYKVACVNDSAELKKHNNESDAVIFISQTYPEAGRGSIKLSRAAHGIMQHSWEIINSEKPVLFISMGNPYVLREVANIPNFICTYADNKYIANALVKAILGKAGFPGKLPVPITQ